MATSRDTPDPVRLEVFHQLLAAACEEAGALLQRSAISPNIRERRDFSCALFDGEARLVAQAAHIPVHLGSARDSVIAARDQLTLEPGDVAVLNDPFAGGTHLPDVTMVRPVFVGRRRRPSFFVVNRAHHADIGGAVPGSMGVATELLAEGLVLPPVKVRSRGEPVEDVLRLIRANVRGSEERMIDLQAQEASVCLAERRLLELVDQHGLAAVTRYTAHLMDYSEKLVRGVLKQVPQGVYRAEDQMEDDGTGAGPFRIRLALTVRRRGMTFDFSGTSEQARGGINTNPSVVLAACVYVLRCLCPDRLPTNDGVFRCLSVVTERGTLVDPTPPAPVAGGNVETSQRLVDVALAALAEALPDVVPASSAGTMSNLSIGGAAPGGGEFAFYETLPGGAGASPLRRGVSGVQTHMTNTRNTPVEELELCLPVRVDRLTMRRRSGGRGRFAGGDGIVKEVTVLTGATASLFAERHAVGPCGLSGGLAGRPGGAAVVRRGKAARVPAKGTLRLQEGDTLRIETPGGGGFGRPERRR